MEKNKQTTEAMRKVGSEYLRTFPPFQRSPSRDLRKKAVKKEKGKKRIDVSALHGLCALTSFICFANFFFLDSRDELRRIGGSARSLGSES